ncbi:MAG: hypothetical protein Tsb0016_26540 [Sphingomonadales bacterium]
MEAIKLLLPIAPFARRVTAGIKKALEGRSKSGIDDLDAKHHVNIPCRPEGQACGIEQQIASRAANDRILIFVAREMCPEPINAR